MLILHYIKYKMKTKKIIQTVIKGDEENASLYFISRSFLMAMTKKYNVNPNKLRISMQYNKIIVQVYNGTAYPVWQTLEIIIIPDDL